MNKPVSEGYDDLVRRIRSAVEPRRIVIFGSTARGEATAASDIDVLVIVPDGTHRRQTAGDIYQNLIGFNAAVDVVVVTASDVARTAYDCNTIVFPALREGIEVYAQPANV